jgi:hypothetical protein
MGTEEEITGTRGLDIKIDETNWGFKGRNYLFLIGIDKYQYWPPLKCAVKDVQDFAEIVTSRYQFEESDIIFLKNADATEKKILAGFKQLAEKVTDQDNLVIYFSGHGHYMAKTGYWIPVNANVGDECEDEFINTAVIVDRLRTINSLHTFLIIDACFSGTLITQIKGSAPKSERYKSRRILTSGRAEVVSDGPEGGNSPFASGILNELRNNTDPYISASKLIAEVREYVEKQAQQTPNDARLVNADDQGGDFMFHLKLSDAEIWATVVKQHTKEAYKKFAEQFPNSPHQAEALETYKYLTAIELNTIASLTNYVSDYIDGKFVPQALEALEEAYWRRAKSEDTLACYFEYLKQFPKGKYVTEAKTAAKKFRHSEDDRELERDLEAERILRPPDTVIKDKPDEEKAWKHAKNVNTFISYRDFTLAFPNSNYLEEALETMRKLDKIASNNVKFFVATSKPSFKEKIEKCINYFHEFPGAPNNPDVKRIKDKLEIERIRKGE